MEFGEFKSLYTTACELRDEFAPQMGPWFRKDASQWPPVIGFGLPLDGQKVEMVTVALNPSNLEIEDGHIPETNNVNTQWKKQRDYFKSRNRTKWFDRSEMVLTAAEVGTYHADGHVHLDLSPQPTSGGFDGIYDNQADRAERQVARQFIMQSLAGIFFPILGALVRDNQTRTILTYGFLPRVEGQLPMGSRTMKETIGRVENLFQVIESESIELPSSSNRIFIARGKFNPNHQWINQHPELQKLRVVFLSQGPSSRRASDDDLRFVGRRLRELGWL